MNEKERLAREWVKLGKTIAVLKERRAEISKRLKPLMKVGEEIEGVKKSKKKRYTGYVDREEAKMIAGIDEDFVRYKVDARMNKIDERFEELGLKVGEEEVLERIKDE